MEIFTSKEHVNSFSERLYNLRTCGDLCDLRLTSGSSSLDLHKVILATMSDLALTSVKFAQKNSGFAILEVRECSMDVLKTVVEFLYLGTLRFEKDTLKCILGVLDDVGVSNVVKKLTEHSFLSEDSPLPSLAASRSRRNCKSRWSKRELKVKEEDRLPQSGDKRPRRRCKEKKGAAKNTGTEEVLVKRGRGRSKKDTNKGGKNMFNEEKNGP